MHTDNSTSLQLFLIILLSLLIRVYYHHHVFMSDEANNLLTIKALVEGDGISGYFFKHPPLFTLLSSIISYPFGDNSHLVQGISIGFSILSMLPLYLIAKKVFDRRTALLSLLILAIMPLNIVYSTWVKQEAMLLFFFLTSLYFYLAGKTFLSGIVFGLALLTKEFALFLVPIITSLELLKGWKWRPAIKRLFTWFSIALLISGWWYAIFGGMSFKAITAAMSGGDFFEFSWHYPWYYYIYNLKADLTLTLSLFFLIGLLSVRDAARLLPLLWFLAFYIPLSLMAVKAPWYTYLASPALSMITATGLLRVWDTLTVNLFKWGIAAIIATYMFLNLYSLDVKKYYEGFVSRKLPLFYEEDYLRTGREILKGDEKVALLEYNPSLQYYLGISGKRVFLIKFQFSAMDMHGFREMALENNIGWFVIDKESIRYVEKNLSDLTAVFGPPRQIGNVIIYTVAK